MNTIQLEMKPDTYYVFRVISTEGKKYKFLADNYEFIESFFSVKGKLKSIKIVKEATDEDFDNLKSLG